MGQRNATYVIVESGKDTDIMPIYNQWNFIQLQSSKMVRGIKAVKKFNWKYNRLDIIPKVYYAAARDNTYENKIGQIVSEWVGGIDETNEYGNGYTEAFQEDNNNGWNIVKFILPKEGEGAIKVEVYCVTGSEDEDRANSTNLKSYFYEWKNIEDIEFLEDFKWNPKLKDQANILLKRLASDKTKSHKIAY